MKKTYNILSMIFCLGFVLIMGCGEAKLADEIMINDSINQMLSYLEYDNCSIVSLGNYDSCKHMSKEVSQKEVDDVIADYLTAHPTEVILDKSVIEEGDLVIIAYEIIVDSDVRMSASKQVVKAGRVNFDTLIEQSVIGKTVGETYVIDYVNSGLKGESIECRITPKYIYTVSEVELNDAFVKEHLEYSTVDEWKVKIESDIRDNNLESAWAVALDDIIELSSFQFDRECILEHATELAFQTVIAAAQENMSMEEYVLQAYDMSEDAFYDTCYLSCEREVKEYLIIGAIAYAEEIHISDEDIGKYCVDKRMDADRISDEDRCYISYYILRDYVMQKLCSE